MLKYIVNFIVLLALIGCKENSTEPVMGNDPALVGKWELVTASVGGTNYNPEDLGIPTSLSFEADGSGKFWDSEGEDFFKWKTSGGKIYIDGEDVMNYSIYGITLVISYQEDGEKVELMFGEYIEPEMGNDPALVGNWQLLSIMVNGISYDPSTIDGYPTSINFEEDGTGKFGTGMGEEEFNWTTAEGMIFIVGEDEMYYSVNGDILILSFQDSGQQIELTFEK